MENSPFDGIGKALELTPKLYDDVAQQTAQQTGKLLGRIPRAINAALSGLDIWIAKREYAVEETKKLLALKLENIEPEKIVPPEPYVAVPAIQAISYSMDSTELREMYANLLAKSMNIDTKECVHPSFVEIIRQMSPIDAQLFKALVESPVRPMLSLRRKIGNSNGGVDIARHILWMDIDHILVARSLDNLSRCNLVNLNDTGSYVDKNIYNAIRHSEHFMVLKAKFESSLNDGESIVEREGLIVITEIGKAFYDICIQN